MIKKILLLTAVIAITSCSKDDDKSNTITDENPATTLIDALGFDTHWQQTSNFNTHFGYTFHPKKNGNIIALTVKVPTLNIGKDIVVTLWDKNDGGAMLVRQEVDISLVNTDIRIDIDPIALDKTHEYVLTTSSVYFIKHCNADNSDGLYPATIGNIEFLYAIWGNGDDFPDDHFGNDVCNTDAGFIFRATE